MYAIIEDSGTQIRVSPGDVLEVDLRSEVEEQPKSLTFDRVLAVGNGDAGGAANLGTPYVAGASVIADVIEQFRGEKIDVIKFKRRKGYRRKTGHRQSYLRVKITDINS